MSPRRKVIERKETGNHLTTMYSHQILTSSHSIVWWRLCSTHLIRIVPMVCCLNFYIFSCINHAQFLTIHMTDGYAFNVSRIRPCDFTLYSLNSSLGLGLLPPDHNTSIKLAESTVEQNPGLQKIVETRNTGFFGKITPCSYLVPFNEDTWRLVSSFPVYDVI